MISTILPLQIARGKASVMRLNMPKKSRKMTFSKQHYNSIDHYFSYLSLSSQHLFVAEVLLRITNIRLYTHRLSHQLNVPYDRVGLSSPNFLVGIEQGFVNLAPLILSFSVSLDVLDALPGGVASHCQEEVKAEETAKWQEDDGGNDRHHHYHCNRAHLLLCLFEEEDDNISNKHENCEESAPKKADKETVVTFSDAVSHHATVMIEHLNTVLAGGTVAGPRRTVDPACLAKFILYILPFQEIFKLDWVRSEEGSSGDDSGVGARSEKEKQFRDCEEKEEDDGQGWGDIPVFGQYKDAVGHQEADHAELQVDDSSNFS